MTELEARVEYIFRLLTHVQERQEVGLTMMVDLIENLKERGKKVVIEPPPARKPWKCEWCGSLGPKGVLEKYQMLGITKICKKCEDKEEGIFEKSGQDRAAGE